MFEVTEDNHQDHLVIMTVPYSDFRGAYPKPTYMDVDDLKGGREEVVWLDFDLHKEDRNALDLDSYRLRSDVMNRKEFFDKFSDTNEYGAVFPQMTEGGEPALCYVVKADLVPGTNNVDLASIRPAEQEYVVHKSDVNGLGLLSPLDQTKINTEIIDWAYDQSQEARRSGKDLSEIDLGVTGYFGITPGSDSAREVAQACLVKFGARPVVKDSSTNTHLILKGDRVAAEMGDKLEFMPVSKLWQSVKPLSAILEDEGIERAEGLARMRESVFGSKENIKQESLDLEL